MPKVEKALLVGAYIPGKVSRTEAEESLAELAELARTAGAVVAGSYLQKIAAPNPAYYVGKGKAEEIRAGVEAEEIDLVIFDENLTPGQEKNLEELLDAKIIDRTGLILDIFAQRARTREGKLQVELAQLNYLLPRLVGKGAALSRLGGGIGTRGPGESKLETDRRRVRERISRIKHDLEKVGKTRELHRLSRKSVPFPVIAIIGYTNAGKSTLFNRLSKMPTGQGALAEDKLFATLDPTIRKIDLPERQTALISDTVGFIKKLPHQLVEAFKATLEEVRAADILLHVIDSSHSNAEVQIVSVKKVLEEIGASDKPVINVFNKTDKIEGEIVPAYLRLVAEGGVPVSAITGQGIKDLIVAISRAISPLKRS
ncbi:MAG: GTPase HflX [Deltaproteobacteria bacterium]|nr:GTPase HflX [Deltaproteobacteria bacterium]